jgi:drug/metabolite transporter (DMT)-like permease
MSLSGIVLSCRARARRPDARVFAGAAGGLSCLEPVVAVVLALAVFGEALAGLQVAGGALVLAAVVVLAGLRTPPTSAPPATAGV